MSKKLFYNKEILDLSNNKYVKTVSEKGITYTDEFKTLFIAEHSNGKMPVQIYEDAGFDVDVIGNDRIWSASKRWRRSYKESGDLGLRDTRKFSSGRPLKRELTQEEIITRKDAEIAYWKAEAELLKKIEMQERQVKNGKLNFASTFIIIQNIISKYKHQNIIRHLCEIAGISRAGYYNHLKSEDMRNEREQKDMELKEIVLKAFDHRAYKKGSTIICSRGYNGYRKPQNFRCDTSADNVLTLGQAYQFKLTSTVPLTITVGTAGVVTLLHRCTSGNDTFYYIVGIGITSAAPLRIYTRMQSSRLLWMHSTVWLKTERQ